MRYHLPHVVPALTFAFGVGARAVMAQPDQVRGNVTASAEVTVQLVPTRAVLYLLIEAEGRTHGEAIERQARASAAVLDTLRRAGGADDITLVQYGVSPTRTDGSYGSVPPNTFTSRAAVRLSTALSRVQLLTAAAYARGANGTASPYYEHEGFEEAVVSAVEEATTLVRRRAEAIARGLGGQLGALVNIAAQPQYPGTEFRQPPALVTGLFEWQNRPIPEIRHTVHVVGTWLFDRR